MFGIDAAIYVYCTYVFVENKNLKPERSIPLGGRYRQVSLYDSGTYVIPWRWPHSQIISQGDHQK